MGRVDGVSSPSSVPMGMNKRHKHEGKRIEKLKYGKEIKEIAINNFENTLKLAHKHIEDTRGQVLR